MKAFLYLFILSLAGLGGFAVGRSTTASISKKPSTQEHGEIVLKKSNHDKPGSNLSVAPDPTTVEKRGDKPLTFWRAPSHKSAEWTRTARGVDRQYGIIYRICALNPVERKLVRDLLTKDSVLRAETSKLTAQGLLPAEIQLQLNAEKSEIAAMQGELDKQAPEVSQFIEEFQAHPTAGAVASNVSERILIETGTLSPDQMELIFSAAANSELGHPVPEFVNSLNLDSENAQSLDAAIKSLKERNKLFIPKVCEGLDPAQISAFMGYLEEQLLALQERSAKKP